MAGTQDTDEQVYLLTAPLQQILLDGGHLRRQCRLLCPPHADASSVLQLGEACSFAAAESDREHGLRAALY